MARTAITLIRRHGKDAFEMIGGPELPLTEHSEAVKDLMRSDTHPEIAEVQYWESGLGIAKKRRFQDPKVIAGRKAAAEKAAAEKSAAEAASRSEEPVSSEASPEAAAAVEGELTAADPAPTPPESESPPAPVVSPAPKKQARRR